MCFVSLVTYIENNGIERDYLSRKYSPIYTSKRVFEFSLMRVNLFFIDAYNGKIFLITLIHSNTIVYKGFGRFLLLELFFSSKTPNHIILLRNIYRLLYTYILRNISYYC